MGAVPRLPPGATPGAGAGAGTGAGAGAGGGGGVYARVVGGGVYTGAGAWLVTTTGASVVVGGGATVVTTTGGGAVVSSSVVGVASPLETSAVADELGVVLVGWLVRIAMTTIRTKKPARPIAIFLILDICPLPRVTTPTLARSAGNLRVGGVARQRG